eukprot:gb/GEZN01007530.1/.p1 GENE.gb/GEZN01007530.1/~~gb/GEZN01007530.1/.p1  ORF type:complete len:282 (+),score=32.15 gb/GEZN01007530.1/:168-1013(+)
MSSWKEGNVKVGALVLGGVAVGAALGYSICLRQAAKAKKPKKVTLKYFEGRGLAELSRTLLAVAGADYTDYRYPIHIKEGTGSVMERIVKQEMEKDAAAGKFAANMGRLPVLDVDGVTIGNSKPIARYIANTYGLMGSSALEAARIDNIAECVFDISEDFGKQTDDAKKAKWFDTSASDGGNQGDRSLQYYLVQLEKIVDKNGFAVGSKFSYADAAIYNKFGDTCLTAGIFGSPQSEPMGNGAKVKACLEKCSPSVAKIVANFGSCPAMKSYLSKRGTPKF